MIAVTFPEDSVASSRPKGGVLAVGRIESKICFVRGLKVLLDQDLAVLYGVETGALNRAVQRNLKRFPKDFMFRLEAAELEALRCQFGISNLGRGGRRFLPYAFTGQGVAMLSGLLNSPRAVAVNVEIMRAFVRLRQVIASHADLARQLAALETKYDGQFKIVFDAIRGLMTPAPEPRREMGFHTEIGVLRRARKRSEQKKLKA